ncbi:MAG: VWA domain-containing protein [Chloroflexi bacterium]|nr:VWA domain-containing protein [Chloroflexota bacterium]
MLDATARTALRTALSLVAVTALAIVAIGVAHGQDAGQRATIASITELEYPNAQAVVNFEDTTGASLQGLDPSNFAVTVGGKPAPVSKAELASSNAIPLDVLLLMDTSGSTLGDPLAQAKSAAVAFIGALAPEDRVAVMRFANSVTLQQDFTSDKDAAIAAVNALESKGQTELYKATAAAIAQAATSTSPRRAMILLTDGAQDAIVTDVTENDAISAAATSGVPVFTIAQGAAVNDPSYLQEIARISNGRYLEAPTPGDLSGVYQGIGRLLQNQYVVTFDASEAAGKAESAVTIQVNADGRSATATSSFKPTAAFAAPTVGISGIAAGEALKSKRDIVVTATGAQPITKAAYNVDGVNVFEAAAAPFTFTYDPDKFGEGEHSLRVSVTIGGRLIDGDAVTFTSIPAAPVNAEPSGGGGSLPVLPIAVIVGALAVIGGGFLVVQRIRTTSGPTLTMVSPDQRVTPWASKHRTITRLAGDPADPAQAVDADPVPAEEIGEALGILISRAGSDLGHEYAVGGKPVSIGSSPRCAVRIDDPRLASEEARIWIRKGNLMLHRLTRLTTIASEGVSGGWTMMDPGETFQVGTHAYEFRLLPEGAPVPGAGSAPGASPDVPDILRDKPREDAPPAAPPLTQPGMADASPRRFTDMMPREMGFPAHDMDQTDQQAS